MIASAIGFAERGAKWTPVLLGLTIPVSVAGDGIVLLLSVIALAIALAVHRGDFAPELIKHPIAQRTLVLFGLLALGTVYGDRFAGDSMRFLTKYLDLLCVPLLLLAFRTSDTRSKAISALALSLAVVLALSYLVQLGALPSGSAIHGVSGNAAVFKKDLTHNFLMAYAAFLFLQFGLAARPPRIRWAWLAASVLAVIDVLLLVRGRTGQLVLASLIVYAGYAWRGWRGSGIAVAALAAATTALLVTPGPFKARFDRTISEAREWHDQSAVRDSIAARLEFYRNSMRIVASNPLGVGTGGFPKAYAQIVQGTDSPPTVNPHNEYLLIAVQIGALGVAALLWLFYTQWRLAPLLPTPLETHLARGLVLAFVVGCIFNSLLLDHTEGLLFAWLSAVLYGGLPTRSGQQLERSA